MLSDPSLPFVFSIFWIRNIDDETLFRTFFVNVGSLIHGVNFNSELLKDQENILLDMDIDHDYVSIVMNNLKDASVKAYSMNIYVIKVTEFYGEIMQNGLLEKIRGLNFEEYDSLQDVKNMQNYIVRECKATQEEILEKVRGV